MQRALDRERFTLLKDVAEAAVAAETFPSLKYNAADDSDVDVANKRALMALIVADELGLSLVDALNRVTFTEKGVAFGPATDSTFDASLRADIDRAQRDAANAVARAKRAEEAAKDAPKPPISDIPKEYMPDSKPKPMGQATVGELAYFFEEASKKGSHEAERAVAWEVLSQRLGTSSAFELGKLTRYILSPKHQPKRREMFNDVLVVAEARIAELGRCPVSDFAGNIARSRIAHQMIDTLPSNPRPLTAEEAKLLASEAYLYRHLAAHFHAKTRGESPPPYLEREAALRPDAPCPACGQNVRVELPCRHPNARPLSETEVVAGDGEDWVVCPDCGKRWRL